MRIVGGLYRGRSITAPKGRTTRPTSDRAREAIFNVLDHAEWAPPLVGARVLDLFAGSGALGLEALSRGAAFCLFVDSDLGARTAIHDNIKTLKLFSQTSLHRKNATAMGSKPASMPEPFDLVFLDPPYGKALGEKALVKLLSGNWVSEDAVAMLEVGIEEKPETPGWICANEREYGASKVIFLDRDN